MHWFGIWLIVVSIVNGTLIRRELKNSTLDNGAEVLSNNPLLENSKEASELSRKVQKAIRDMRGGTDEFYRDLLDALTIKLCEEQTKKVSTEESANPRVRFVNMENPLAYKNSEGNCVRVGSPEDEVLEAYDQDLCEVKPNCFWNEIVPGDQYRATMYSREAARKLPPDDQMDEKEAEEVIKKWATGLVAFVAPGIILSVLSLLTMILFLLCRCCCNRCGGRKAKKGGYTCGQKLVPLIIFVIFSAGIIVTAAISLLFNEQVGSAVTDVFNISSMSLDDSGEWIVNARLPLTQIRDQVLTSVDEVKVELNGTDFVEYGLGGITDKLDDFGLHTANVKLPRGCVEGQDLHCIPCGVCTTISNQVTTSSTQMRAAAGEGVESLRVVRQSLNGELVNTADTIKNVVDEKVNATLEFSTAIDNSKKSLGDVEKTWDEQDNIRAAGVLAMFALSIAVIAIGIVGIILGFTPLSFLAHILHIAYLIGFIALFIGFMVAAIMIALSVLLGDTCEITSVMTEDWTPLVGKDAAQGLNACFRNESLLEAYNLTDALDFNEAVQFPDSLDLTSMLNFSALEGFAAEISNTDASTFPIDQAEMQQFVDVMNTYTGQNSASCLPNDNSYALTNVLTPWTANGEPSLDRAPEAYLRNRYSASGPNAAILTGCETSQPFECSQDQTPCNFEEFVIEIWVNVSSLVQIEIDAAAFLVDMKANMTGVMDEVDDFKVNITNLDGAIVNIQTSLTSNLFKYADDFKEAMYCNFIGEGFSKITFAMCNDMMPALLMISLMIFLMGIFLIPVNITLIILCKRLKATGNGYVIPSETDLK